MDLDEAATTFKQFVAIIKALRTPETGCPWDLEQTHQSLRPYLLEEAHEVLETIDREQDHALREELGDLLLQIVLHAQIATDRRAFTIDEVIKDISEKMVRRHPHVFGEVKVGGSEEVIKNWEQIKAAESKTPGTGDAFDRVPQGLPALMRSQRLGDKAEKLTANSVSLEDLLAKMDQVSQHFRVEMETASGSSDKRSAEFSLGDLLFVLCQVARKVGVDAESSLRIRNSRFVEQIRADVKKAE